MTMSRRILQGIAAVVSVFAAAAYGHIDGVDGLSIVRQIWHGGVTGFGTYMVISNDWRFIR